MKNTFPITLLFQNEIEVVGTGEVEIRDHEVLVSGVINADCTLLVDRTLWAGELVFTPIPAIPAHPTNEDHLVRGDN